jgi:hypothetical protein
MAKSPGWEAGETALEGEIPAGTGYWTCRLSAVGQLDGLRVAQNFFLVAGPSGEQVVVSFTMTPAQAEKIGTRDLEFVRGLEFTGALK